MESEMEPYILSGLGAHAGFLDQIVQTDVNTAIELE